MSKKNLIGIILIILILFVLIGAVFALYGSATLNDITKRAGYEVTCKVDIDDDFIGAPHIDKVSCSKKEGCGFFTISPLSFTDIIGTKNKGDVILLFPDGETRTSYVTESLGDVDSVVLRKCTDFPDGGGVKLTNEQGEQIDLWGLNYG